MKFSRNFLAVACLAVLSGILVAGLWPFNPHPHNDVSWIPGQKGILFGAYGSIYSANPIRISSAAGPCSVEIWFQPADSIDSNSILDFYTPSDPLQFQIGQSDNDLYLSRDIAQAHGRFQKTIIRIAHVFDPEKRLLLAITSDGEKALVYLNGERVASDDHFGLTSGDFKGQIVIGTSPTSTYSWSGQLLGLAIYSRQLSASEVARHYANWNKSGQAQTSRDEGAVALYDFNEGEGKIVHNKIGEPDIHIPDHFTILDEPFLKPFWKEYSPGWEYVKDISLNVIAFVPLGFLSCAYFSSSEHPNRPILRALLLGALTSVSIEILQAFLPMRNSGTTDIITNTTGTAIGAAAYSYHWFDSWLAKFGVRISLDGSPSR